MVRETLPIRPDTGSYPLSVKGCCIQQATRHAGRPHVIARLSVLENQAWCQAIVGNFREPEMPNNFLILIKKQKTTAVATW